MSRSVKSIPNSLEESFEKNSQEHLKLIENLSSISVSKRSSLTFDYKKVGNYSLEWKFADCPFNNSSIFIGSNEYQLTDEKYLIKVQYLHKVQLSDLNALRREYDVLQQVRFLSISSFIDQHYYYYYFYYANLIIFTIRTEIIFLYNFINK